MARRLYSHGGDVKRVSRPAIRIATMGVTLGVAIMIISVCVVLGFKREVENKVMGMAGQIQVVSYEYQLDLQQHPVVVDDSLMNAMRHIPGVKHVQRVLNQPGMVKTDEAFQGVMLKGVGPDYDTLFLSQHLVDGELPRFSDEQSSNNIVISRTMARELQLDVGSKVFAYFFDGNVRARRFTVKGIYATHMSEFDKSIIFTDIHTTQRLAGFEKDQFTGAELSVETLDDLDQTAYNVAAQVNHLTDHYGAHYTSPTVRDLYPGIFSWLSLLDTNVVVILILMISVAAFTMISGLLIIILECTQFIGVMKALGSSNRQLRHLFQYFASFIILKGIVFGNVLAFALIVLQVTTGFVQLDEDTYYVKTVPLQINWLFVTLINVGTLVISFFVLVLPSLLVSRIQPAKSIRFE